MGIGGEKLIFPDKAALFRRAMLVAMELMCFLSIVNPSFATDGNTSNFEPSWLKVVLSIEQLDSLTNSHPIGTGFLLNTPQNHIVLITAKHVILNGDGTVKANLAWRLNEKTNASDLVIDQVQSAICGGWYVSSNADLACRFITYNASSDIQSIPTNLVLPQKILESVRIF